MVTRRACKNFPARYNAVKELKELIELSNFGNLVRSIGMQKSWLKIDEVIEMYPEGVSISRINTNKTMTGEMYYSYEFEEQPGYCFSAGGAMNDLIDDMIEEVGSLEKLNEMLAEEGAEIFKFEKTKSRSGRTYIKPIYINNAKWKSAY